jgi:hypothetical protein
MSTDYTPPTFTRHVNTKPPDTLYHYTGQLGLLGMTQTRELWATKIQYMNDAAEFHLGALHGVQSARYNGFRPFS